MKYRASLFERYYTTQYKYVMPRCAEGWDWVLERIEQNFGEFFLSIPRDSRILDAGCGVGYLEHYLAGRSFTKIRGVDISGEQIDIARQIFQERRSESSDRVTFEIADAFECLRVENRFDVVAMLDFLEHFNKGQVIELLTLSHNALRDGGFLVLTVINAANPMFGRFFYHDFSHETPFTLESLRQCLLITGFKLLKVDYEKIPIMKNTPCLYQLWLRFIQPLGLRVLGRFLGVPHSAFCEDLVAVARK